MGLSAAQVQALLQAEDRGRPRKTGGVRGRPRALCAKGGASLGCGRCCHGVERASCRRCGGSRLCVHLQERKFCVECAGTRVCEHGRIRVVCVECGGNRVCRTCRGRVVLKRDTDCTVCRGAREWAAWMGDRLSSIYSTGGVVARETDAGDDVVPTGSAGHRLCEG